MNHLHMLTRYKAWADGLVLAAISTVPTAELEAPRPIVFGSLIRTLHHVYAMDHVWQCHLSGQDHGLRSRNPDDCPGLDELTQLQTDMDRWYIDYADGLTDQTVTDIVEFEFIGGGSGRMSRQEIILHVVNHTTYHRGHAADILYTLGVAPPTTDLPVFVRHQDEVI